MEWNKKIYFLVTLPEAQIWCHWRSQLQKTNFLIPFLLSQLPKKAAFRHMEEARHYENEMRLFSSVFPKPFETDCNMPSEWWEFSRPRQTRSILARGDASAPNPAGHQLNAESSTEHKTQAMHVTFPSSLLRCCFYLPAVKLWSLRHSKHSTFLLGKAKNLFILNLCLPSQSGLQVSPNSRACQPILFPCTHSTPSSISFL